MTRGHLSHYSENLAASLQAGIFPDVEYSEIDEIRPEQIVNSNIRASLAGTKPGGAHEVSERYTMKQ